MTKEEIIEKVHRLNLPADSYIVFGSCPLAVAGIREARDIDLLVSGELFRILKTRGWREQHKGPNDTPLVYDVFEAHAHWDFDSYTATVEQLLPGAMIVRGVPFASLDEVRKWKAGSKRAKDQRDVRLIDKLASL